MKTRLKYLVFLLLVTISLVGCSAQYNYCRGLQKESPIPFSVDACRTCRDRYGDAGKEAIIGCSIGLDVTDAFVE